MRELEISSFAIKPQGIAVSIPMETDSISDLNAIRLEFDPSEWNRWAASPLMYPLKSMLARSLD